MRRVRKHRLGVMTIAVALVTTMVAGGCGSGGSNDTTGAGGQFSVAQLIVFRGGAHASGEPQVLLGKTGAKAVFSPNTWVLPSGGAQPNTGGQVAARTNAVNALDQQTGIKVNVSDLTPYAHWIIPGFDTVYYMTITRSDVRPRPDGVNFVDARWLTPQAALAMQRAGTLHMEYLTIKQLESLEKFSDAENAVQTAKNTTVTPIQLKIVGQGDKAHAVLPEDAPQG